MKLMIQALAYHRNGMCGNGFHVATFTWHDRETDMWHHMVATIFEEPGTCAVLDIDQFAADNIAFARGNSWRGDRFEGDLRQAIIAYQKAQEDAALWDTASPSEGDLS